MRLLITLLMSAFAAANAANDSLTLHETAAINIHWGLYDKLPSDEEFDSFKGLGIKRIRTGESHETLDSRV